MKVEEESEKVGFKLHIQKPKIIAFDPITSWEIDGGKMNTVTDLFSWAPKSLRTETEVMKLKDACSWEENYTKSRQCIKKQRRHFADKGPSSQRYGFSNSHVWMWELDHKEGWALRNWCFWTVVLEKTHENPLDAKESKPVNPKGNQLWIFIGRTCVEAEALILWPHKANSSCWKSPRCWERLKAGGEGNQEHGLAGRHNQVSGHEFAQAPRDSEGQGSLVCCSPWGHKNQTQLSNWTMK